MLLLDNSAWAQLGSPSLTEARRAEIADLIERGQIAVCTPFLLEAGWWARSAAHHNQLLADLLQLPRVMIDSKVEAVALTAQQALARRGHHRSASPSDLLIAACAHAHGSGVLHYDHDYDVLLEITELRYESHWLAPAGAL